MTEFVAGLVDTIAAHDAFILDQWGVMHNGARQYPGVATALAALEQAGKPLAVLSNSGKRAQPNVERLGQLGFAPERFAGMVSGGETLWQALAAGQLPVGASDRYHVISWDDENVAAWCAGQPPRLFTADITQATGVIVLALPGGDRRLDNDELLAGMLARGQDMFCGNPDVRAPGPAGIMVSPGSLAAQYERRGGVAHYFGKPHPAVFARALALLGDPPPGKVLMVGDNLATDIAGGARLGLSTLLLRQGVHGEEFGKDAHAAPAVLALLLAADASLLAPSYCALRM